ncbi:4-hydroxybenzoate polyprenyltransferase [Chitinophaga sp. CF118]|nr:4-hydroxybenzoate polyprenyltransferase [Chitinophaga sp. CF118]
MRPLYCKLTFRAIIRELRIAWGFINNDIWDTIMPSLLIFITSCIFNGRSWKDLMIPILISLTYAVLYIYTFCISNQIDGIEEDRINKPYRPLVTGFVTMKETFTRMYAYNFVYLVYALFLGLFWYSLAWTIISYYLNLGGWSNHWISKNLVGMTLGTFILFNVQWQIALQPEQVISYRTQAYFAMMSIWAGFALPIQDLRDVAGDLKGGRKTLPIAVGDRKARIILSIHYFLFLPAIFLCAMLTMVPLKEVISKPLNISIFIIQMIVHWLVAYRLLVYTTPEADHRSYLLYVLLFCAAIPMVCVLKS